MSSSDSSTLEASVICGFVSEVVSRESNETNSRQTHRPNRPRQIRRHHYRPTSPKRRRPGLWSALPCLCVVLRSIYPLLSPVASSLMCTTLPPVLPPSTVPLLLKSELPTLADTAAPGRRRDRIESRSEAELAQALKHPSASTGDSETGPRAERSRGTRADVCAGTVLTELEP